MVDKEGNKDEQRLRYKLEKWQNAGYFDILNNISKYVTLVQLMDSLGDMNHAVSVDGKWIFDSN